MKKVMIMITVVLAALLGACEVTDNSDKLVVLTSSGYAPYEIVTTDGTLTGFDIELMEAIALEMGVEIEWSDVAFEGIIASIETGQADIAIAGLSPTEERKQQVDFSTIYYNAESGLTNFLLFDPSAHTITGLSDLTGLVVGAQTGTVQANYLDSISSEYGFTLELRTDNTAIIQEILTGNIDVLVVDAAIEDEIIALNQTLDTVRFESSLDDTVGNAIAVTKGSPYLEEINAALVTLEENGTIAALITKWFE